MKNIEKLNLIEDNFSYEDANEILSNLFSSKINFHNVKNLISQVRFSKDDESALERVPALKNEMAKLQAILSEAKATQKRLVVNSQISITLSDK